MMAELLDPRDELLEIERRFAKWERLNPALAAVTPMPKRECAPIGWDAVNYLRVHRSWMLLTEFSGWYVEWVRKP